MSYICPGCQANDIADECWHTLVDIVRFMLDRHEAQAVAARGLARMALAHESNEPE